MLRPLIVTSYVMQLTDAAVSQFHVALGLLDCRGLTNAVDLTATL